MNEMDRSIGNGALEIVLTWEGSPQRAELYAAPCEVKVGEAEDAAFMLPREAIGDDFVLAEPNATGDGWSIRIPSGAKAQLVAYDATGRVLDEEDLALLPPDEAGVRALAPADGKRVRIDIGAFSFFVRKTEQPQGVARPVAAFDWHNHRWVAVSLAVHAGLLVGFLFAPPDAGALSLDLTHDDARYVQMKLAAIERERPVETASAGMEGMGQPMPGDEGTAGAVEETRHTGGHVKIRGRDTQRLVPLSEQQVRTFGILGALASIDIRSISSPFGAQNVIGADELDAYGNLLAARDGFSPGSGGFGVIGTGRGGGCDLGMPCAAGTVGVGTFGTIGGNGGTCGAEVFRAYEQAHGRAAAIEHCSGTVGRAVSFRGTRESHVPRVRPGVAQTMGGLSAEQIRRVIQRHIPEVRHCYEQALISRPDLEGRVAVAFTIQPAGNVQMAQVAQSTVDNTQVSACVTSAVRRWSFPQSPGVTAVTYPFVFEPAG